MINRKLYLQEPEKWFGTKDEEELVDYCLDYIKKNKVRKHEKWFGHYNGKMFGYENLGGVKMDVWFLTLSKKVLEVYDGKERKKFNKRCNKGS